MNSTFLAHSDGSKVEGIVGQAWVCQNTVFKENLPLISRTSTEAQIEEYAQETWVTKDWVLKKINSGRPLYRSLCAVPVVVKNKPWGVLVVDSTNPTAIKAPNQALAVHQQTVFFLSKLLERK